MALAACLLRLALSDRYRQVADLPVGKCGHCRKGALAEPTGRLSVGPPKKHATLNQGSLNKSNFTNFSSIAKWKILQ